MFSSRSLLAVLSCLLEGKIGIISNRLYALVHRQICVNLNPLSGITHIGEVKTPVSGILHARKLRLETRLYWIWTSHAIVGTKVERLLVPLAIDIDDVIELRILRRWMDVPRIQYRFDEFILRVAYFQFRRL